MKIIPTILCGGSGTRLWPASNEKTPKQFLRLFGEHSLLQTTILRAIRISGASFNDVITVTHESMIPQIKEQYNDLNAALCDHIIGETQARNTAAAVALAAIYAKEKFGPDTILWILPADHHIGDEKALQSALNAAIEIANSNYLVTFGITPSRPETGYGYIKAGESLNDEVLKIERFVEKPDLEKAMTFLQSGDYLWNSGMFVFRADTVISAYKENAEVILNDVAAACSFTNQGVTISETAYSRVEKTPFDIAIMEKANNTAVVPANPAWSDIGSWQSIWEQSEKDSNGNTAQGDVIFKQCENTIVHGKNRLIACIGLKDIVIAETDQAILIADKSNSEAVKDIVNELKTNDEKTHDTKAA